MVNRRSSRRSQVANRRGRLRTWIRKSHVVKNSDGRDFIGRGFIAKDVLEKGERLWDLFVATPRVEALKAPLGLAHWGFSASRRRTWIGWCAPRAGSASSTRRKRGRNIMSTSWRRLFVAQHKTDNPGVRGRQLGELVQRPRDGRLFVERRDRDLGACPRR